MRFVDIGAGASRNGVRRAKQARRGREDLGAEREKVDYSLLFYFILFYFIFGRSCREEAKRQP